MKTMKIDIARLQFNEGQIVGLPKNPRFIRDERFDKLVQSIRDLPEMMELRELIVYPSPLGGDFIVIGGNMRLRGCKELEWDNVPCKVLPAETSIKTLKEIAIKDNLAYGEDDFDLLNEEWDMDELDNWGMELTEEAGNLDRDEEPEPAKNMAHQKQIRLSYPEKEYNFVKEELLKLAETPEMAVILLLSRQETKGEKGSEF